MSNHCRELNSKQVSYVMLTLLLFISHLQAVSAAAATPATIDLTSEYAVLSKSSSVTNRNAKVKIARTESSSPSSLTADTTTLPSLRAAAATASALSQRSTTTIASPSNADDAELGIDVNQDENASQQMLVAMSSKSYITAPTTPLASTASKLAKRAGTLADLKSKKFHKIIRNYTRETDARNKLPNVANDHIPDSSGHIPYRIGRPILPPPPPDYDTSGGGGGGGSSGIGGHGSSYHSGGPYEAEKWQNEYWDRDYTKQHFLFNNTRVQHIEAECQDDYMKIRVGFNGTFSGLVYSAGYAYDPDCMYINGSGRDYYEFYIQLNRCGTLGKNALHDEKRKNPTNFMWNTVTVQYNPLIEEEYDEHFKVTCEYGYDFWKTVTFPFLDVEVATGNPVVFTLSPPECYMEIQNGYGIGGPRVTGPVRVGDPLTLIIYMRSKYDGFDIVVNDCYAHNGANKRIHLIDDYGCPVDDKLISRFRGSWSDSGIFETQVYAYMKTFRFTGSPALYIECDVRMCHGRCPSQPCHWRNLKAVTKREISSNMSSSLLPPPLAIANDNEITDKPETTPLSENVNLFQSLRVLQEGETDGDNIYSNARRPEIVSHQTCLKTTTFSAMTATFSLMLCLLSAALMIACSRLKQRSKERSFYDTYITHKGQID